MIQTVHGILKTAKPRVPGLSDSTDTAGIAFLLLCIVVWLVPILSIPAPKFLGIAPMIAVSVGLFHVWRKNLRLPKPNPGLLLCAGAILALALLGWSWAADPTLVVPHTMKSALSFLAGFLFLSIMQSLDTKQRDFLMRPLPILLGIAAVLIILEVWADYPFHRLFRWIGWDEKVRSFVVNRGTVALVALLWPCLLWLSQKKRHADALRLVVLVACATFYTDSQSSWLGLTAALLAWPVVRYLPGKATLYVFFLAVAIGTLCAPILALKLYEHKPAALIEWKVAAAGQRMEIWHDISLKILESPLTGQGVDSTRVIKNFHRTKDLYKPDVIWHPHNSALQLWIELGLPGVLAGLAFVWFCIREIGQMNRHDRSYAFSAFLTLFMISLVGYSLWQGWFLGLFGVTAALSTAARPSQNLS